MWRDATLWDGRRGHVIFLLKYWKDVAMVALFLGLVGTCQARDRAKIAEGQARERIRVADSTLKVLAGQQRTIDSVFIHDTLRFTTSRDVVRVLTDSVDRWKRDTLEVVRYVERTTETINDCTALLSSCNARVGNLEAQLTQERSKAAVVHVMAPQSCTVSNAAWGVGGTVLGFLAGKRSP